MGGVGLVEERGDERGNLWEVFFEGEMASVEEVDLGIGEVAQVGAGPLLGEEGVVAAPDDEGGRLMLAQPLLPGRVELDVAVVVQRQGDLRVLAARLVEEVLVEGPPVGGDQLR